MNMRKSLYEIAGEMKSIKEKDKNFFIKDFFLSTDFLAFQGHFPKQAVLPAIVQVLMAQITIEEACKKKCQIEEIIQGKFTSPVIPNQNVRVKVYCLRDTIWQCEILTDSLVGSMRLKMALENA